MANMPIPALDGEDPLPDHIDKMTKKVASIINNNKNLIRVMDESGKCYDIQVAVPGFRNPPIILRIKAEE